MDPGIHLLDIQADGLEDYGIEDLDGILLIDASKQIVGLARVFRMRRFEGRTRVYFESHQRFDPPIDPSGLGMTLPAMVGVLTRLDWPTFEGIVQGITGAAFASLPPISGNTPAEQAYFRELLHDAVRDDLLGPAGGPREEILGMSVRDRYVVGKLAPRETAIDGEQIEELGGGAGKVEPEDGGKEIDASTNTSLVPSSLGFTFCVDQEIRDLMIEARWGRYERAESSEPDPKTGKSRPVWKRIPSGGTLTLKLVNGPVAPMSPDGDCPEIVIQGSIRQAGNGDRLITLFLVNAQAQPKSNPDQAWIFQPEVIARHPEGAPVFRRRPVLGDGDPDEERTALEMIYRRRVEFAVGHGVSIHAEVAIETPDRASGVRTIVMPGYEVGVTETPGLEPEDRPAMQKLVRDGFLDMRILAGLDQKELGVVLAILANDYETWIGEQRNRIGASVVGFDAAATEALLRCDKVLERLREGIHVLGSDARAWKAFKLANLAMADQRVRSIYALEHRRDPAKQIDPKDFDIPKNRSWRPFQLAFVLLSIPALADPTHRDRTDPIEAIADLLWFPTGGGKTEAYLGVAAFTMVIRRLQGIVGGLDGTRGLAVIMRYTLRLLTLQQFQRATTLICALEMLRKDDPELGGTRFTIGLWVGQKVTPNTTEQSHRAILAIRNDKRPESSTPAQLTTCPWCGEEIEPKRDIEVDTELGITRIFCGDKLSQCPFSRNVDGSPGIPVLVVDEEIYHRPPSMLIATVDKFAMMAWKGDTRTLFGRATRECPRHGLIWPGAECNGEHKKKKDLPATTGVDLPGLRPPDLIIQDEFHLISGPLGTMVGLYETAVDELCAWKIGEKVVRPKVVASSATVRKGKEQVKNVFLREISVFPPHGLDVEDNFFAVQRGTDRKPGRQYVGVCAPGSSRPAVLIRLYVALLTAGKALFDRFGPAADPYMTVVGYFNSLRELGGMKRLAEDDVQTRAFRVQRSDVRRPGLAQRNVNQIEELTSRVSSKDIPKKLDQLEVKFKTQWAKGETRAIDVVLATNMLSVGVDVNRLGLMAVNGQPKSTAEYIQATSRVGRAFPGIVFTVLVWSRPRDLSHYETFEHYHATFYKHVEAQSVTPFSPRAMDRGLTGAMVSLLRGRETPFTPNLGAQEATTPSRPELQQAAKVFLDRAWKATNQSSIKDLADLMVGERLDQWAKEAQRPNRQLGYERPGSGGTVAPLLSKPGFEPWGTFTVPMSMREVEPGVRLQMETRGIADAPPWRPPVKPATDQTGGEE
ncbi:MAG: DISARM system helicase DrmA [Holophagaceae bacterium]|nr:DISARM system helicase DrmA [Holophagaceae bacterium]